MNEGQAVQLGPSQLAVLIEAMVKEKQPLLITGQPGVGKSQITAQVARKMGVNHKIYHPAICDPTDFKGVCWPNVQTQRADILPLTDLAELLDAKEPTIANFEDLGQAPRSVQAPFMQLMEARRLGPFQVPKCVTFIATTNRRTDRAGVEGLLEPVKSRFVTIVELVTKLEDSLAWWYAGNRSPLVAGFLRMRPDLLCKFDPSNDMGQSPLPRTWAHVDTLLKMGLPGDVETAAVCGAVGVGAGGEFIAYVKVARELFDLDEALRHPDKAPIPEAPSALYATVAGLAYRATAKNFGSIVTYAERLRTGDKGTRKKQGVFGVLLILDSFRRNKEVGATPAFEKVVTGELGKLIRGEGYTL